MDGYDDGTGQLQPGSDLVYGKGSDSGKIMDYSNDKRGAMTTRWSSSEELTLLQLLAERRPFAADHGKKKLAWENLSDILRTEHNIPHATWENCQNRMKSLMDDARRCNEGISSRVGRRCSDEELSRKLDAVKELEHAMEMAQVERLHRRSNRKRRNRPAGQEEDDDGDGGGYGYPVSHGMGHVDDGTDADGGVGGSGRVVTGAGGAGPGAGAGAGGVAGGAGAGNGPGSVSGDGGRRPSVGDMRRPRPFGLKRPRVLASEDFFQLEAKRADTERIRLDFEVQHLKAEMDERRRVVELLKAIVQGGAEPVSRAVEAAAEAVENASRAVQSLASHLHGHAVGAAAGAGGQQLVPGMPDNALI